MINQLWEVWLPYHFHPHKSWRDLSGSHKSLCFLLPKCGPLNLVSLDGLCLWLLTLFFPRDGATPSWSEIIISTIKWMSIYVHTGIIMTTEGNKNSCKSRTSFKSVSRQRSLSSHSKNRISTFASKHINFLIKSMIWR